MVAIVKPDAAERLRVVEKALERHQAKLAAAEIGAIYSRGGGPSENLRALITQVDADLVGIVQGLRDELTQEVYRPKAEKPGAGA